MEAPSADDRDYEAWRAKLAWPNWLAGWLGEREMQKEARMVVNA